MVATVILGMLCVHLFCFCIMFMLISTRLQGKKMGMDVFAVGSLLLCGGYVLQLLGGPPGWNWMSVVNHTLTLSAPFVYVIGGMRFFNRPTPLWRPLLAWAATYTALQILTQWWLGPVAHFALLSGSCTVLFLTMAMCTFRAAQSFAKDLRVEMLWFTALIGGLGLLNCVKFFSLLGEGMQALDMDSQFQMAFYIYMSFLATVLPPSIVWLVLRRLSDELRSMAAQDPLTQLLNRRGLLDGLERVFRRPHVKTAHLLMVDIDHFKHINDSYGHQVGDSVLCHVAGILQGMMREGDLICRLGGEEFVLVCLDIDDAEALQIAERIRSAIEGSQLRVVSVLGPIRCTATIGVSGSFRSAQELDATLQQADAALYRGKVAGRNRVEALHAPHPTTEKWRDSLTAQI